MTGIPPLLHLVFVHCSRYLHQKMRIFYDLIWS